MKGSRKQIQRISRYEDIYDRVSSTVRLLTALLDYYDQLRPEIDDLAAYYSGEEWKKDFADDEAGLLPKTLKRGVLSEDAVYDLLDDVRSLAERVSAPDTGRSDA